MSNPVHQGIDSHWGLTGVLKNCVNKSLLGVYTIKRFLASTPDILNQNFPRGYQKSVFSQVILTSNCKATGLQWRGHEKWWVTCVLWHYEDTRRRFWFIDFQTYILNLQTFFAMCLFISQENSSTALGKQVQTHCIALECHLPPAEALVSRSHFKKYPFKIKLQ